MTDAAPGVAVNRAIPKPPDEHERPFHHTWKKLRRLSAELSFDVGGSLLLLISIKIIEYALGLGWPDGLVFFTHTHLIELDSHTLFDIAHVANLAMFLGMGIWDCIKVYRS